ncbi:hypothetical protein E2C01_061550 [Portunus trituberculatus]|uniref:Uncharacterized protein n=1 Tax=Portunus trituberculatus TaxID=210409 RepID=A0A5B7HCP3_PORTR|nr:hypothetical protein [Portunus trituberculatus]
MQSPMGPRIHLVLVEVGSAFPGPGNVLAGIGRRGGLVLLMMVASWYLKVVLVVAGSKCEGPVFSPLPVGVSMPWDGAGLLMPGTGLGSSGDTSMTGGEGLRAESSFPRCLSPKSENLLLRGREVGVERGVDISGGVRISGVSWCGCLAPGTDGFIFTDGNTGSGV